MDIKQEQISEIISNQNAILNSITKLVALITKEPINEEEVTVLSMYEASRLLNISQAVLKEACFNRELPCRKLGDTYIFSKERLLKWIKINEVKVDVEESIDSETAAELLGVSLQKVRQWAKAYNYYKIPVVREGYKYFFDKELLLKWAQTTPGEELIREYLKNCADRDRFLEEAQKRYAEERKIKEEQKKARIEKKLATISRIHKNS